MNEESVGLFVGLVLVLTFGVAYAVSRIEGLETTTKTDIADAQNFLLNTDGTIFIPKTIDETKAVVFDDGEVIKPISLVERDPRVINSSDAPEEYQARVERALATVSTKVEPVPYDDPAIQTQIQAYEDYATKRALDDARMAERTKAGQEATVTEIATTGKISVDNVMPKITSIESYEEARIQYELGETMYELH